MRLGPVTVASLLFLAFLAFAPVSPTSQIQPSIVGHIEGDGVLVKTSTNGTTETDAGPTVVASGSEVTVGAGHALLTLEGGGEVSICGPAHFSMLKSGNALTLALDYGRVHPSLDSPKALTIYTPTIVATPISIGGGPRDMTLGLNHAGEMCIFAGSGAARVEQQLSGQSLIVPQNGTVSLQGGQIDSLRADPDSCSCEYSHMQQNPPRQAAFQVQNQELSVLRQPIVPENKEPPVVPPPPSDQQPVYTVLMPPLTFDASTPAPPPGPSPETVLLVREVRVRPAVIFRGHVDAETEIASVVPVPRSPASDVKLSSSNRPSGSHPGLLKRFANFFRKMFGGGLCVGAGCRD